MRDQGPGISRRPDYAAPPGSRRRPAGAVLTLLRTRAGTLRAGTLRLPGPLGQSEPLRRPLTAVRLPGPRPVRLPVRVLRALCLPLPLGRAVRVPGPLPPALCLLGLLPVPLLRALSPLGPWALPLPLGRPRTLPLRQPRPLLLAGSALRLARACLGWRGPPGPCCWRGPVCGGRGRTVPASAWRTSNWVRSATSRTSATTSPRSRTSLS